ncbi:MAG: hybrid sensor histidine kinase/response regulator [Prolixibacteraceae bacterium]|jgi:two-component system sensor histidine kinase/response regulator|nr:hybrid sensor histidine kinase/response regulator [Prolixibacteraceae bacterium]
MRTAELNNKFEHNLLIIDDEPEIVKALTRQFRRKYNVFSTTNAEDGFGIMERENIQVVLSDQRMPGITGVDFFARIKSKYPDALKLILTGYSDIEAVIGAINDGQVFRYVTKPWNPDELETIIKEAFEKYELITNNRRLMHNLQEVNETLEEKVKERTLELEKVNEKLSELNTEKNRYIGIVAHDLRSPIGTAESFSNLLIEDIAEIEKDIQLEYLKIINNRCNFSLDLIHNFLDVSKIEAGIFDLNLTEQNYLSFVEENILQEEILAKNKAQNIVIESTHETIEIHFDTNKIQQALNNLLSNAIKYSMPNTNIKIEILKNNNEVITKIIDQGQGIPKEELPNVFQAYKTTSVKATANEKSTGLGLAIVKKIIEAHGGKIWVESEEGLGSTFYFTIPNNTLENS